MNDLLNTAPCGFMTVNDDGIILSVNTTLEGMLGRAPGELCGKSLESILPVASRVFYQTHLFPVLKLHGRAEEVYLSLRLSSGEDLPVLVNASRGQHEGLDQSFWVVIPMRQRRRYEDEILEAKRAAEEANRLKDELIYELSTPVVTIWKGVLLAPVIGILNRERAGRLTEAVLHAAVELQASVVILDITGVRTMDNDVVIHLSRVGAAVRLLGAECVLTGISAKVAHTLVRLGADLDGIEVRRRLSEGLLFALQTTATGRVG